MKEIDLKTIAIGVLMLLGCFATAKADIIKDHIPQGIQRLAEEIGVTTK